MLDGLKDVFKLVAKAILKPMSQYCSNMPVVACNVLLRILGWLVALIQAHTPITVIVGCLC